MPPEISGLQLNANLTTQESKRLVLSAISTYQRSLAFYDTAAAQIRDGKLPAAHETLEAARDLMADLRRRNQVVVFSDHMNAYHAEMEHLLNDGPKLLGTPDGLPQLMAQAGVVDYLARRRPAEIRVATLADRGATRLPMRADVVGVRLDIAPSDIIECNVPPYEPEFKIELLQPARGAA